MRGTKYVPDELRLPLLFLVALIEFSFLLPLIFLFVDNWFIFVVVLIFMVFGLVIIYIFLTKRGAHEQINPVSRIP